MLHFTPEFEKIRSDSLLKFPSGNFQAGTDFSSSLRDPGIESSVMSGNARSDDELALAVRAIEQSNLAIGQALNNDPQGLVTVVAEQLLAATQVVVDHIVN